MSLKGLNIHRASCLRKCVNIRQNNQLTISNDNINHEIETSTILEASELIIERENVITPNLPPYKDSVGLTLYPLTNLKN